VKTALKNYWRKLLNLLNINKKKWLLPDGYVIEHSFVSGGRNYYKIKNIYDTCVERGLAAITVYEEVESRVSRKVLEQFIELMEATINDPKGIKIADLAKLIGNLKERMSMVIPPSELIWKFASVIYFDENESPFKYDAEYCRQKIARWKEAGDIAPFFFHLHLKDLFPSIKLSVEDLEILQEIIDKMHDLPISANLSGSKSSEELKKTS
jgi:hypothetical protein